MRRYLPVILLLVIGCRGLPQLREDRKRWKETGTEEVYKGDFQALWKASKDVLRDAGAEGLDEDLDSRELYCSLPSGALSYGTLCCVYVLEDQGAEGQGTWKIGVITRRRGPLNVFTVLTEGGFHHDLKAKLSLASQ